MYNKNYANFVRPASPTERSSRTIQTFINGEEARRLYLEEVKEIKEPVPAANDDCPTRRKTNINPRTELSISDKDLFITVQNDEVDILRHALDKSPDKINMLDDYGWSLLMIACQANSIETVKELMKRGINTNIRDRAGNSAQSLVIKNKNFILADLLLSQKYMQPAESKHKDKSKKKKLKVEFLCEICNKTFLDKEVHLSSTIHNINASKGKKIPPNYKIPQTNKGFQLMVKVGWDKESGLGPDGSGQKYPIKTIQKKDRKGLGHERKKGDKLQEENAKTVNRKAFVRDYHKNRRMEINFRREFY